MLKSNEKEILMNSRLALDNSTFFPLIFGLIILSAIYFNTYSSINFILGYLYLVISVFACYRYNKKSL